MPLAISALHIDFKIKEPDDSRKHCSVKVAIPRLESGLIGSLSLATMG